MSLDTLTEDVEDERVLEILRERMDMDLDAEDYVNMPVSDKPARAMTEKPLPTQELDASLTSVTNRLRQECPNRDSCGCAPAVEIPVSDVRDAIDNVPLNCDGLPGLNYVESSIGNQFMGLVDQCIHSDYDSCKTLEDGVDLYNRRCKDTDSFKELTVQELRCQAYGDGETWVRRHMPIAFNAAVEACNNPTTKTDVESCDLHCNIKDDGQVVCDEDGMKEMRDNCNMCKDLEGHVARFNNTCTQFEGFDTIPISDVLNL